jgi:hypothetical protein
MDNYGGKIIRWKNIAKNRSRTIVDELTIRFGFSESRAPLPAG